MCSLQRTSDNALNRQRSKALATTRCSDLVAKDL
ncbi:hypothetical protein A2U01_0030713, partial [Trifolium medium]|nr:hypothetical protein [Trifolium medium]